MRSGEEIQADLRKFVTRWREYPGTERSDVGSVLAYLDVRTALTSGDLVFTGTPAGVGRATGVFLAPGDVIDATIEGVGTLHSVVGISGNPAASGRDEPPEVCVGSHEQGSQ
jgi:hypothetical protein